MTIPTSASEQVHAAFDVDSVDSTVGKLRSAGEVIRWTTILAVAIGSGAVAVQFDFSGGAGTAAVLVGICFGALFGGVAAVVFQWMAQMLLAQRTLVSLERDKFE